jgi:hypothetical protein
MSKKSKGRKEVPKGKKREEEEEEEDEVRDLLNFPSLSPSPSKAGEKYDRWLLLACAATVASVYIATLFPSVPGGKKKSGVWVVRSEQRRGRKRSGR